MMKKICKKLSMLVVALTMVLAAGTSAFAAAPNEDLIAYLRSVGIPESYVSQADTFLKETGKVLTADEVGQIEGYVDTGKAAAAREDYAGVEAAFRSAVSLAGYSVTDFHKNGDGTITFVVFDPVSGKSITVTGSSVAVVSGSVAGQASGTTHTGVSKTAVDNGGFVAAGVLAVVTALAAGWAVTKKRAAV